MASDNYLKRLKKSQSKIKRQEIGLKQQEEKQEGILLARIVGFFGVPAMLILFIFISSSEKWALAFLIILASLPMIAGIAAVYRDRMWQALNFGIFVSLLIGFIGLIPIASRFPSVLQPQHDAGINSGESSPSGVTSTVEESTPSPEPNPAPVQAAIDDANRRFTETSDGYDWKRASVEYRRQYCDFMASKLKVVKPDITGDWLYDLLSGFYDTNKDPSQLKLTIHQITASGVGISSDTGQ
jgi:hypothetical protein